MVKNNLLLPIYEKTIILTIYIDIKNNKTDNFFSLPKFIYYDIRRLKLI